MPGASASLAWWLLAFAVAWAGTAIARRYALSRNLVDLPGERRSHAASIPRGGGISMVFVAFGALIVWVLGSPAQARPVALLMAGLLLVAGAGWIDDHRDSSPWWRLAIHALAAALLSAALLAMDAGMVLAVAGFVAALVLVNVWNFMDGIDGLAASQALLCAIGFAVLGGGDGFVAWLGLAVAAGCCGFLPFNVPRARVFMGDVGSGSLGYLMAILGVLAADAMPAASGRWTLLLPPSVFLIDATLTLGGRMVRRERWWTAHVQHLYQKLGRSLERHMPVTAGFALVTLLAVVIAVSVRDQRAVVTMSVVIGWYFVCIGAWVGMTRHPRFGWKGRSG